MPLEQAVDLFKAVFINYRIAAYKDLGAMYVFEAYSPEFDLMEEPKTAMDPWYYVDKKTSKVNHYYPFNFDPKKFFEMNWQKIER